MLRTLRTPDGGPALRVRLVAALLVVGLMLLAAPLLVPVLRWLVGQFF